MSGNTTPPIEAQRYQRVILPTDGSEGASYAAEHGLMLADALGATAHIVSVVEDAGSVKRDQLRTSPEELATEAVDDVRDQAHRRDIDIRTATLSGTPTEAILGYIAEHDIDLAVMGTHGRTGIDQVIFGSIAEDVIRQSPIPVLTVKPPQWEE